MYEWGQVMRRCAPLRGSIISKAYILRCRHHSSESSSLEDRATKAEGNNVDSEPLTDDVAVKNAVSDTESLSDHVRGHKKGAKNSLRRPLPISPLMDEQYLAATQRHRLPKLAPSKKPTPFQQQLARNPYARALATPVRMCTLTRTNLPSFFLQDFELIAHPSTNEPWYLPRSLTSPYAPTPSADSAMTSSATPSPTTPSQGTRQGPKVWVLSRSAILHATIGSSKSPFKKGYERFPSSRSTQWKAFRPGMIRWRTDIDTFVLELMRRRVVEGLKYLCGRNKGYLGHCRSWKEVPVRNVVGAVLWLGPVDAGKPTVRPLKSPADKSAPARGERAPGDKEKPSVEMDDKKIDKEQVEEEFMDEEQIIEEDIGVDEIEEDGVEQKLDKSTVITAPGEFATLDLDKEVRSKVPVHNLQVLLGEAHIKELRQSAGRVFDGELAMLKNKRPTVDMQLRLWKLQGYLSRHGHVDDV